MGGHAAPAPAGNRVVRILWGVAAVTSVILGHAIVQRGPAVPGPMGVKSESKKKSDE